MIPIGSLDDVLIAGGNYSKAQAKEDQHIVRDLTASFAGFSLLNSTLHATAGNGNFIVPFSSVTMGTVDFATKKFDDVGNYIGRAMHQAKKTVPAYKPLETNKGFRAAIVKGNEYMQGKLGKNMGMWTKETVDTMKKTSLGKHMTSGIGMKFTHAASKNLGAKALAGLGALAVPGAEVFWAIDGAKAIPDAFWEPYKEKEIEKATTNTHESTFRDTGSVGYNIRSSMRNSEEMRMILNSDNVASRVLNSSFNSKFI